MPDPPSTGPPLRAQNLDFLRKQAKALLRAARENDPAALARLGITNGQSPTLSLAQHAIAREAGFARWPKLQDELRWRHHVRTHHRLGSATPLKNGATMTSSNSLELGPIDQIGLTCTDLDQAQKFYCDLLGLDHVGDAPQMKFFGCDGVKIIMFKKDQTTPGSILYFRVPGEPGLLEKKLNMLKSKNVKVESDAHCIARNWNGCDVWMAFFRDPFDNLLALKSDVPMKK